MRSKSCTTAGVVTVTWRRCRRPENEAHMLCQVAKSNVGMRKKLQAHLCFDDRCVCRDCLPHHWLRLLLLWCPCHGSQSGHYCPKISRPYEDHWPAATNNDDSKFTSLPEAGKRCTVRLSRTTSAVLYAFTRTADDRTLDDPHISDITTEACKGRTFSCHKPPPSLVDNSRAAREDVVPTPRPFDSRCKRLFSLSRAYRAYRTFQRRIFMSGELDTMNQHKSGAGCRNGPRCRDCAARARSRTPEASCRVQLGAGH